MAPALRRVGLTPHLGQHSRAGPEGSEQCWREDPGGRGACLLPQNRAVPTTYLGKAGPWGSGTEKAGGLKTTAPTQTQIQALGWPTNMYAICELLEYAKGPGLQTKAAGFP